jgi:hypothetical protein
MPFGQQQPVVARMLDEPSAGLHQPLLQAGQRPLPDPRGQRQPAPQIPEVISDQAQPQPHLVSAKAMTGKPRHRDRLLTLLYPLFSRAALVVERTTAPLSSAKLVTIRLDFKYLRALRSLRSEDPVPESNCLFSIGLKPSSAVASEHISC